MSVFVHIGPPKTATTSLQKSVIPHLGLPFEIVPQWARSLARDDAFSGPPRTETDLIVSSEILGDFARFTPEIIADRLSAVFRDATILCCEREPLPLFYSLYRQRLVNELGIQSRLIEEGKMLTPARPVEFLARQWNECRDQGTGFFAVIDIDRVRAAFGLHFSVKIFEYETLSRDPQAFAEAFAEACGRPLTTVLSWDNPTTISELEELLAQLPKTAPELLGDRYRELFAMRLPLEYEEFVAIGSPRRYLPIASSTLLAPGKQPT